MPGQVPGRRWWVAMLVAVVFVAGCGDQASTEDFDAWAVDVCGVLDEWQQESTAAIDARDLDALKATRDLLVSGFAEIEVPSSAAQYHDSFLAYLTGSVDASADLIERVGRGETVSDEYLPAADARLLEEWADGLRSIPSDAAQALNATCESGFFTFGAS